MLQAPASAANIQAGGLPDSLHEVPKTSSRRAAQCCSCGRWGLSAANSEVQWPSAALCPGKFSRAESKQHWQLCRPLGGFVSVLHDVRFLDTAGARHSSPTSCWCTLQYCLANLRLPPATAVLCYRDTTALHLDIALHIVNLLSMGSKLPVQAMHVAQALQIAPRPGLLP